MSSAHYGIMKFELKTEKDYFNSSFLSIFLTILIIFLIVLISNISIKLGTISKNYEINYLCKLLTIEKSSTNFKKLSKISTLTSKQKIWDLCKVMIK